MKEIWLSPSDLSYFWSDSKVGFYDKYILKIQRPKLAFPSVFTTIDLCMRHAFDQVECTDIVEGAPSGHITHEDINVQSKLFTLGDFKVGFKGKIDCLLDTNNGKHFVVDYKTTHISQKLASIYFLQLMAYAFCLQNPLHGEPKDIEGLGLIVFQPENFNFVKNQDKGVLDGQLKWVPISYDKEKFKYWIQNDLKSVLHSERDNLFKSGTDLSWERFISSYTVEEIEDDNIN
jgi:hypothetical protein